MPPSVLETAAPEVPEVAPVLPASLRHNKPFLSLWSSQVLSQLADRVVFVVFVAYIAQYHGASETYNSLLYIAFTIPAILLTAIAGVFVDRWSRRRTLVFTNLLRAAFIALVPWLAHQSIWGLYGIAFLVSSVTQFFVPAEAATIPALVPKHKLLDANSAFTTTMMTSVIIGFALGDPLISWFGLECVHWAITGLFALAAIVLLGVGRLPPTVIDERKAETVPEALQHLLDDLREGWAYVKATTVVWQAMLKLALVFSTLVALCILAIGFAKQYLYENPVYASQKFGYIVAASGVGMALGAVLVSKSPLGRYPRPILVYTGLLIIGLGLLVLTSIPAVLPELHTPQVRIPPWSLGSLEVAPLPITARMGLTYLSAAFIGSGAALASIPLQALLHERIPETIRGKVMGLQFTLLSTSSTFPVLIAGLGTEWFGVLPMFWLLALPFLVWGGWGVVHVLRAHRHGLSLEW